MQRPLSTPVRDSLQTAVEMFEGLMTDSPAEEYLGTRGISTETARVHRLGYVPGQGGTDPYWARFAGRLAVPNVNAAGVVVGLKFRALGDEEPKYDGPSGLPARLFNLRALTNCHDIVTIVEGEMDAISLTELGIPAVGVPGASNWREYHARIFAGFERIVMIADNDKAGNDLQRKILASGLPVMPAAPPAGLNDVNEALVAGYGDAVRELVSAR